MRGSVSEYMKSSLTRREFGEVTVGAAGALALPLKQEASQPQGGGRKTMVKNINMLYRKPELTHEEFLKHWREVHAPLARNVPGIARYVLCPVIPQPNRPNDPGVDGVAEVWFESTEAMQNFSTNPEAKKWGADGRTFISHSLSVNTEEIVIIGDDLPR